VKRSGRKEGATSYQVGPMKVNRRGRGSKGGRAFSDLLKHRSLPIPRKPTPRGGWGGVGFLGGGRVGRQFRGLQKEQEALFVETHQRRPRQPVRVSNSRRRGEKGASTGKPHTCTLPKEDGKLEGADSAYSANEGQEEFVSNPGKSGSSVVGERGNRRLPKTSCAQKKKPLG